MARSILPGWLAGESSGYPDRHWRVVRRSLGWFAGVNAVLGGGALELTLFAIHGRGEGADRTVVAAAMVDAIYALYLWGSLWHWNDVLRHAQVMPYFQRRVGEIDTFLGGRVLARHVVELDLAARGLGLAPLSAFGWADDLEGDTLTWHDPAAGLETVQALLALLKGEQVARSDRDAIVADLEGIAHALSRAGAKGIWFSLLLRHSTATNGREWEARQGTCF